MVRVSSLHVLCLLLVVLLWTILFYLGLVIPTHAMLDKLWAAYPEPVPIFDVVATFFAFVTGWSVTNIGALTGLAAFAGEIAHQLDITNADVATSEQSQVTVRSTFRELTIIFGRAIVRGFLLYLAVLLPAILLIMDDVFAIKVNTYFRLAGSLSLTGFMIGYKPKLMSFVLSKALATAERTIQGEGEPPDSH